MTLIRPIASRIRDDAKPGSVGPHPVDRELGGRFFEARLRAWRGALLVAAVLLAVQLPLELRREAWQLTTGLRVAWVLALLAAVPLVDPNHPRRSRAVAYGIGALSGCFAAGIVAASGGPFDPRFGYLLAFPLVVAVLAPDVPWAAGAMGAATLLGGLAILVGRVDAWFVGEWALLSAMATGLAVFGTYASRRLFVDEVRWRVAHEQATVQYAEVERLAAVGRLAAAVTHHVGSPLAVVKANLQFLLATPGVAALDPEAIVAIQESLESSDRVARILRALRAVAREPEPRVVVEVADLVLEAIEATGATGRRLEFKLDLATGPMRVRVGRRGVVLALVELLEEATRRAPQGRPVTAAAAESGGFIVLVLECDRAVGAGTPPEEDLAAELAVTKELLERSGAVLGVSSGAGTLGFTIRIPAEPPNARAGEMAPG